MATAEDKHYTRFDDSLLDDQDFVDTGMMRRAAGNLNHLADQFAQHRIKWVSHGADYEHDSDSTPVANDYFSSEGHLIVLWRSLPFDLHVRDSPASDPGGHETYRCRCRVRMKSGHATHTATLRGALHPVGAGDPEVAVNGVNVGETNAVATTTHQWEDLDALIYLDAPRIERATAIESVPVTVGGEMRAVPWLRVQLTVAGKVSNTGATAALSGVELSEYVIP